MPGIYDHALAYEIAFSYRDFPAEVDTLLAWAGPNVESVLELASGPAEHAIECARRGLSATALDLSEAMVERARHNAVAAAVKLDARRGDMRAFTLPVPVDFAFCMISSISYMLSLEDMVAHLTSVRDALRPGGGYLIEGSHPGDYLGAKTVNTEWDEQRDGVTVHMVWGTDSDRIEPATSCTDVSVSVTASGPDGMESFASVERDRFWTPTEVRACAMLAGFEVRGQYGDWDGRDLRAEGAWRTFTLLRRPL